MRRQYWAERHGLSGTKLDLPEAVRLYLSVVGSFRADNLLQHGFGYTCVDDGFVPGLAGTDVEAYVSRLTRRSDLWPLETHAVTWDEAAFMTAVEFMHDHVSLPTDGRFHTWKNCGFHGSVFDDAQGQRKYRDEVNAILADYSTGFELQMSGEVLRSAPEPMTSLLSDPLPVGTAADVKTMVASAVGKFRRRSSSAADRRDAVRDLADVLELLRSRARDVLDTADERDLFQLANKFGIRHLNDEQKVNYDKDIWFDWMFYYYLASIHAFGRLIERVPLAVVSEGRAGTEPHVGKKRSFPTGSRVRHVRLGEGVVLASKLTRNDEEVTVRFEDGHGIKTLLASIANLETLPD